VPSNIREARISPSPRALETPLFLTKRGAPVSGGSAAKIPRKKVFWKAIFYFRVRPLGTRQGRLIMTAIFRGLSGDPTKKRPEPKSDLVDDEIAFLKINIK